MMPKRRNKTRIQSVLKVSEDKIKGTLDLRPQIYIPKRERPLWRIILQLKYVAPVVGAIVVAIVGVSVYNLTQAQVTEFYASSCLGDWQNSVYAQGAPDADGYYNFGNSAVWNGSGSGIFCGGFEGTPPNDSRPTRVTLMLSWQVGEQVLEEPDTQEGDSVITETVKSTTSTSTSVEQDTEVKEEVTTEVTTTTEEVDDSVSNESAETDQESQVEAFFWRVAHAQGATSTPPIEVADESSTSTDNEVETLDVEEVDSPPDLSEVTGVPDLTVPDDEVILDIYYTLDGDVWEYLAGITKANWRNSLLPLPVESWHELANIQIQFKNVGFGPNYPDVFLDSVWIEAEYESAPIANVLSLEEDRLQNLPNAPVFIKGSQPLRHFRGDEAVIFDFEIPQLELDQAEGTDSDQTSTEVTANEEELLKEFGTTTTDIVPLTPTQNTEPDDSYSQIEEEEALDEAQSTSTEEVIIETEGEGETSTTTEEAVEEFENNPSTTTTESPPQVEESEGATSSSAWLPRFLAKWARVVEAQGPPVSSQPVVLGTRLIDPEGKLAQVSFQTTNSDGRMSISIDKPDRQFKPGKYKIQVDLRQNGIIYTAEESFTWGVLAINTNFSTHRVGDESYIQMAALDERGDTLCDADLRLEIKTPSGAIETFYTEDGTVELSESCGDNNVTDDPDYFLKYVVGESGTYDLRLENLSKNFSVEDSFEVSDIEPFYIERKGATRINPFESAYQMIISVESVNGFSGTIEESLPVDFEVWGHGEAEVSEETTEKKIVWDLDIEPGEKLELRYIYQAPRITPMMFLVGPLSISPSSRLQDVALGKQGSVYEEDRQWQLASDATGNMILFWDGTGDAPTGWSCISCGSGDAYQKFLRGSTTYSGAVGGASTHNHTATGVVNLDTGGEVRDKPGSPPDIAHYPHTHTYSPSITASTSLPEYRTLKVIRSNTAGEVQIPVDAIAIFDTTVPSGYSQYSSQNNKFIYGENSIGTNGGSNSHIHDISSGTTGAAGGNTDVSFKTGASGSQPDHTHSVPASSTGSVDHQPPYISVILGQKITSDATAPNGLIAMWDDTPQLGWDIVSGSGGDFEAKFMKASTTYDTSSQGSTSHTHSDVTGITSGGPSGGSVVTGSGSGASLDTHTHSVDVTSFNTPEHMPPYTDVIIAKRNVDPVPQITNLSLNSGSNITLTEGTFVWASSTMTITDEDSGCQGLSSVDATLYVASTTNSGTTCSYNGNSCYPSVSCQATSTDTCDDAADPTADYECGFKIWNIAQPTDSDGWPTDIWSVAATSSDGTNSGTATNTGENINVTSLFSLDVTSPISYGSVAENSDTGSTNQISTTTNTGNVAIDFTVGGDNMKKGVDLLSYSQQKHSTTSFTYSTGGTVLAASTTPNAVDATLPKPTSTTTPTTDLLYWGISIPNGQATGVYTGTNYFTACADGSCGEGAVKIDNASDFGTLSAGSGRQIVRTTTGLLYAALNDGGSCEIWKSDDNGSTWIEQDGTSNPTCSSGTGLAVAVDGGDVLHLAYRDETIAQNVNYTTFYTSDATTTAADTFGSEETADTAVGNSSNYINIAVDSDDKPHIAYLDIDTLSYILAYTERVTGSWSTTVNIENAGVSTLGFVSMVVNEDDIVEVSYLNVLDNDLTAAVGNQNRATSFTLQDVDTAVRVTPGVVDTSIVVDSVGNTIIAYIDEAGEVDYPAVARHADGAAWSSWSIQTNTAASAGFEPAAAVVGTSTVYVLYEDPNDDIVYDTFNSDTGNWAGNETVLQGGTYQNTNAKSSFFNDNLGDIMLDYLFSDGTDVWYDKITVLASPTSRVNITTGGESSTSRKIVRTTRGDLYVSLACTQIWKSSDNGATWAEQDSANNPGCQANAGSTIAIDGGDVIHMTYKDDSTSNLNYINFYTDDATTTVSAKDTFGTEETNIMIGLVGSTAVVVDSNDIPHAVASPGTATGTAYTNRIGGSWKTPIVIDDEYGVEIEAAINEDDVVELSYMGNTSDSLVAGVGNQNNATSFSTTTLDATVNNQTGEGHTSIAVDSSGNTWVGYADGPGGGGTGTTTLIKHNDSDAWSTWQTAVTNNNVGYEPTIATFGTDVYVFYENTATGNDIVYDMYNGSWLNETTIEDGTLYRSPSLKWSFINNNGGSLWLDYYFDTNSQKYYNVFEL